MEILLVNKWKAIDLTVKVGAISMAILISILIYDLPERNLAGEFLYTNRKLLVLGVESI